MSNSNPVGRSSSAGSSSRVPNAAQKQSGTAGNPSASAPRTVNRSTTNQHFAHLPSQQQAQAQNQSLWKKLTSYFSTDKTPVPMPGEKIEAFLNNVLPGRAGQFHRLPDSGRVLHFFADGSGVVLQTAEQHLAGAAGICLRRQHQQLVVEQDGVDVPPGSEAAAKLLERVRTAFGKLGRVELMNLKELVNQIKTVQAEEAEDVRTALQRRLGLDKDEPVVPLDAVLQLLGTGACYEQIATGALGLRSLIQAVGHVSGIERQLSLIGAIEGAITARCHADPKFASRAEQLQTVPPSAFFAPAASSASIPPKDASVPKGAASAGLAASRTPVQAMMREPWFQHSLQDIRDLFLTAGPSSRVKEIAASLQEHAVSLTSVNRIGDGDLAGFMPAAIEQMIADNTISSAHAALARAAAARVAKYVEFYQWTRNSSRGEVPYMRAYTRELFRHAIDPVALERILNDPRQWTGLLKLSSKFGNLSPHSLASLEAELQQAVQRMAATGFLGPELAARLSSLVPDIVEAQRKMNEGDPSAADTVFLSRPGSRHP